MHDHSVYRKFCDSARRFPTSVCLTAEGESLSYAEVHQRVLSLARYLQHELHVSQHEAIIVVADQSRWWLIVSLAVQAIGAVEFPVESAKPANEIAALAEKTGSKVIIVLDAAAAGQLLSLRIVQRSLALIVASGTEPNATTLGNIFQSGVGNQRPLSERTIAVSAIIATSGTTAVAKHVPVLQRSFLHAMRVIPRVLKLRRSDVFLSCLPSWHLYARLVEYVAIATGGSVVYSSIPALAGALKTSGVTVFPSFPEIWEAVYRQIISQIEKSKMRIILRSAIRTVIKTDRIFEYWFSRTRYDKQTPSFFAIVKLAYLLPVRWVLQRTIFRAIRRRVSPTLRYAIMGDAPLPLVVDETLRALGFQVLEGYGSTEQCVTALRRPTRNFPGAVGRVLPGVHVTIEALENSGSGAALLGEICVTGPNVFAGYFADMQALKSNPQPPLQYKTGDIGSLDSRGNLVVVGRKINAFRVATGETVFPELVENVLRGSRFVGWVVVTESGDRTPVALVVPDFHELLQWLAQHSYAPALAEYAERPEKHGDFWLPLLAGVAKGLYQKEFERLLIDSGLSAAARPTRIHLLPRRFHRGAELTQTLKPRREFIRREFKSVIFAKRE